MAQLVATRPATSPAWLRSRGRPVRPRAARRVIGDPHGYLNFAFDVVRSLVSLEAGRAEAGYQAAMAGLSVSSGPPPDVCEFLVPLAVRALADRAEVARDTGMANTAILSELGSLEDRVSRHRH